MKIKPSKIFCATLLTGLCFLIQQASGLPFVDNFNEYTNGPLGGQINPEGNAWGTANTNTGGIPDMNVTNLVLTYPGLECPGTNSIIFNGGVATNGTTDRIAIGQSNGPNAFVFANGTVYYSFVFEVQNVLLMSSGGGFVCGFNNLTGPQSANPTTVGARLYMKLAPDNTGFFLGIGKAPATPAAATFGTNEIMPNTTNFIVASYTFVNGGADATSNDFAQLWINPDPTNFGIAVPPVPDLTNNIGNDVQSSGANSILSFLFREGNAQIPLIQASQLRIAHCWGCVTPPANPPALIQPTASLAINNSNNSVAVSWGTNAPCALLQVNTNGLLPAGSSNWTTVIPFTTIVVSTNGFTETNTTGTNAVSATPPRFYRVKSLQL